MSDKKKAFALRNFKDEGTGETFPPGEISVSEGAYINYKAAGLIADEAPKPAKATADSGNKPS
jgi:hypothetical protein